MTTVFIGGSRHLSRLSGQVKERLDNMITNDHEVVVGDANGADKAVQRHFLDAAYDKVTVFCSGRHARNNLGQWHVQSVATPSNTKGFQFYAAKDREMASKADFGLMVWDGRSSGTILNVLRLIQASKSAVLINMLEKTTLTIKSAEHWNEFLSQCSSELRADLQERATVDEWALAAVAPSPSALEEPKPSVLARRISASPRIEPAVMVLQPSFLAEQQPVTQMVAAQKASETSGKEMAAVVNAALASGDPTLVIDALGNIARARGMTHIAKEAGLARESLYRSLGSDGNPEFATILKVVAALGLRIEVSGIEPAISSK